jgi:hypothetical protein
MARGSPVSGPPGHSPATNPSMPRPRTECGRGYRALRGGSCFRRSVRPLLRAGHVASPAPPRPPRILGLHAVREDRRAAGRWCLGLARSLMVTPWFAAGAGIVIAAALAVDSPSALTYAPSGPDVNCHAGGCTGAAPGRGPDLATATPGLQIATGAAPGEGPAAGPGGASGPAGGSGAGPAYRVGYQILRRWPSGFTALMTLPGNLGPGAWTLQFTFASAHVDRVWGARWQPSGSGDGGTATGPWRWGAPGPGGNGGQGGNGGAGQLSGSQLMVSANGTPTSPSGCTLDGQSCRFG